MKKYKGLLAALLDKLNLNDLYYLGGSQALPAPLTKEEESALLDRLRSGDESVREPLIEHNIRLVIYIARKFENTGIPLEDLASIGTIGLIKAAQTFDPGKNIKLATYASRCIENEILMHFRSQKKTLGDIYIDDPIDTDKDGNALTLMDIMGDGKDIVEQVDLSIRSGQLYGFLENTLDDREFEIIKHRYGLYGCNALTQREVAQKLNISRSYVSRIEKKALSSLRKMYEKNPY